MGTKVVIEVEPIRGGKFRVRVYATDGRAKIEQAKKDFEKLEDAWTSIINMADGQIVEIGLRAAEVAPQS